MAEIVNLRLARKRSVRDKAADLAAEQRLAHGIPKSEKKKAATERNKSERALDGHRIETGDRR